MLRCSEHDKNFKFWFAELVPNVSLHSIYLDYVGGSIDFLEDALIYLYIYNDLK